MTKGQGSLRYSAVCCSTVCLSVWHQLFP